MSDGRLQYEKPRLQYWTAAELDAIEATTSGGSGSSGGSSSGTLAKVGSAPEPYQWFQGGTRKLNSSIAVNNAELVTSTIVTIATAGMSAYAAIVVGIASAIATWFINRSLETVYYKSTYYEVDQDMAYQIYDDSLWHPVGYAIETVYYGDSSYSKKAGRTVSTTLDEDTQYLIDYLF